ncbi:MAG: hypothetical protein GY807_11205, partial [Gammaproteobacteria bacterium]|nr:hypothetical protein [Gammaproteobacteria bacterium]
MAVYSGMVVFSVEEDTEGGQDPNSLYATDGTVAGTALITDFSDPQFGLSPGDTVDITYLDAFGGGAVFALEINSSELLGFTDGTLAGTVLYGPGDASPAGDPYIPTGTNISSHTSTRIDHKAPSLFCFFAFFNRHGQCRDGQGEEQTDGKAGCDHGTGLLLV